MNYYTKLKNYNILCSLYFTIFLKIIHAYFPSFNDASKAEEWEGLFKEGEF